MSIGVSFGNSDQTLQLYQPVEDWLKLVEEMHGKPCAREWREQIPSDKVMMSEVPQVMEAYKQFLQIDGEADAVLAST